uniref:Uncharacterized protein n=1 Tax=Aegilops tauschii subsp. strangulata TaxID=200361 RepID=A0A453RB44_AEGTS
MNGTLYVCLACVGCNWLYSCTKRSAMRSQYNLKASPCMDCCVHFFCESCALCQEYKELENRGFNMAKGRCVLLKECIVKKIHAFHKGKVIMTKSLNLQDGKVATRWWDVCKA